MPDDQPQTDDRAQRNLQNLLAKHNNDSMALAATLLGENAGLREDKRTLTSERDALKAKVPGDGAIVLTGDDAKLFADLTAKAPLKELPGLLDAGDKAAQRVQEVDRRELIAKVARAHDRNPVVLERLARADGLTLVLDREVEREVTRDGKTVREKGPAASVKDATGKSVPFEEYESTNWNDLMPALRTTPDPGASQQPGTSFVQQRGPGQLPASTSPVAQRLEERQKGAQTAPDPFAPPPRAG